ncbi:MAG: FkbM family methyltransferase [Actinobacteria bacterium]|nr:FkbM family methyltransferase [Actinomycetota bacterium]
MEPGGWKRRLLRTLPSFEEEMALLGDLVPPGGVCVDVGASYGLYAVALARLVGRAGCVHAFEPRPRSRRVLRVVTSLMAPGNVRVHAVALSDRDGDDVLVTPQRRWLLPVPGRTFLRSNLDASPGGDRYYAGWEDEFGGATEQRVAIGRLDGIVEGRERVGFVKIDVEGTELRVLRGAAATIVRDRPPVLCEIEARHTAKYGRDPDEVPAWFAQRGYTMHTLTLDGLRRCERVTAEVNNYLFVPDDRSTG